MKIYSNQFIKCVLHLRNPRLWLATENFDNFKFTYCHLIGHKMCMVNLTTLINFCFSFIIYFCEFMFLLVVYKEMLFVRHKCTDSFLIHVLCKWGPKCYFISCQTGTCYIFENFYATFIFSISSSHSFLSFQWKLC